MSVFKAAQWSRFYDLIKNFTQSNHMEAIAKNKVAKIFRKTWIQVTWRS